ncbi:decaprenyl-phosphate phosphoribosyltransferase [Candidatus Peregrinibacteria bacterium]|nr:decaprenyl-phosphate phosphoribosyltransferase [Candidatus Peregrinibacteria bacterium]
MKNVKSRFFALKNSMKDFLLLLRPHQWLKNLFIFFPAFFGLKILDGDVFLKSASAFIGFCFLASALYIFNDLHDIHEDQTHPEKKNRPLAAGKVSKEAAKVGSSFLIILGFMIFAFGETSALWLAVLYVCINILYTLWLKHISIIDVVIIASGFVIRIFVGSFVTGIPLSMWIVLMTFLFALFIALAKRHDDVRIFLESGQKTRKSVDGYNLEFLNFSLAMLATISVVSYIMYTTSPEVISRLHSDKLYLTSGFVILGFMRYMQLTLVEKKSHSPTEVLLKDNFIQFCVLGWGICLFFLLYE